MLREAKIYAVLCMYYCIVLLSVYVIFYQTSWVIDWNDPTNWKFTRRRVRTDLLTLPHHKQASLYLDCAKYLRDDNHEISKYNTFGRIILEENQHLDMSCDALRKRVFPEHTERNVKNRYAISRVVYKDYFWLESSVSANYSPNNMYCFAVDLSSSEEFYQKVQRLSECFDNVIVPDKRFDYDSNGHFINFGHYECTKALIQKSSSWKYIMWLQNNDIMLKTNMEISNIIDFLNGSHSIGHKPAQWKRYNIFNDWTAKGLHLWKNESSKTSRQLNAKLELSQNYNEVFLSREIVDYVMKEMNFENLLKAFEKPMRFATDELLWATLAASPDLQLPGVLENGCQNNDHFIFRYNEWEKWYNPPCKSGQSRHGTCIFGMEYFKKFSGLHHIVANKMMPDFDYGLAMCMHELLYNRSYLGYETPIEAIKIYSGDSKKFC